MKRPKGQLDKITKYPNVNFDSAFSGEVCLTQHTSIAIFLISFAIIRIIAHPKTKNEEESQQIKNQHRKEERSTDFGINSFTTTSHLLSPTSASNKIHPLPLPSHQPPTLGPDKDNKRDTSEIININCNDDISPDYLKGN